MIDLTKLTQEIKAQEAIIDKAQTKIGDMKSQLKEALIELGVQDLFSGNVTAKNSRQNSAPKKAKPELPQASPEAVLKELKSSPEGTSSRALRAALSADPRLALESLKEAGKVSTQGKGAGTKYLAA